MKSIFFYLILMSSLSFGQVAQIEKINGEFVLTEGKFSLVNDEAETILIKNIRSVNDHFSELTQFGTPKEVIEKKDIIKRTMEFVYDGLRMRYGGQDRRWVLEYIEITSNYGIVATKPNGSMISRQVLKMGASLNEHLVKMSNGRVSYNIGEKVKLRKYAMMYDKDRRIVKQVDKDGNFIIDRWSWAVVTMDGNGNVKKIEYFIDNDT